MIKQKYQVGDVVDFHHKLWRGSAQSFVKEKYTGIIVSATFWTGFWTGTQSWEYVIKAMYFPKDGEINPYPSEFVSKRSEDLIYGYASNSDTAFFKLKYQAG